MNKTPLSLLRSLAVALTISASLAAPAAARGGPAPSRAPATVDACSWDRPGNDPFMGDVVAAVDRYQDIPVDVRQRLKARMVKRDYDDLVSIRRDSITGGARARYGSTINDMHFGNGTLCRSVSRAAWSPQMHERGLVYCESGQCILVPTVCRNVSRIARAGVAPAHAEGDEPDLGPPPVAALEPLPMPFASPLSPPVLALGGPGAEAPGGSFGGGGGSGAGGGGGGRGGTAGGGGAGGGAPGSFAAGGGSGPGSVLHSGPGATPLSFVPISPVPEPETWALLAAGLAALAARRRRRTRASIPPPGSVPVHRP